MTTATTLTRSTFEAGAWFCHKSRSEQDEMFHFYRYLSDLILEAAKGVAP